MSEIDKTTHLTLAGVRLSPEFPFMNAPGSVNGSGEENFRRDFSDIVRAPGAVAMIGSVTPEYKAGNEAAYGGPVYRHIRRTGLTYNSMGLPNLGIRRIRELLPELAAMADDHDKKLAVSLAPLTPEPGKEWAMMAELALEGGADMIEFNAGCPNIYDAEGKPKTVLSLEPDAMGAALEYVQDKLGSDFAAGVKLSPAPVESFAVDADVSADAQVTRRQAEVINGLRVIRYAAVFNTFGGKVPVDEEGQSLPLSVPGGAGGVSGPGVARPVRAQTEHILEHLDDSIDVVVAGGIATGGELRDRLAADSRIKLGSAVTALWEASSMGAGATRIAEEYVEAI
jgi:dihydroorotate dehydrogenase